MLVTAKLVLKKACDCENHWWLMTRVVNRQTGQSSLLPLEAIHVDVLSDWIGTEAYTVFLRHQPAGRLVALDCAIEKGEA